VAEDLALERWRKLVWNIPFNGLSILAGRIDTAAILADEDLRRSTIALMEEVIAAANKCGHMLPITVAAEQMKQTETMGAYKPSTLLDFEAGKRCSNRSIAFARQVRPRTSPSDWRTRSTTELHESRSTNTGD
jgi:2-dehydropantoate 2-reductase